MHLPTAVSSEHSGFSFYMDQQFDPPFRRCYFGRMKGLLGSYEQRLGRTLLVFGVFACSAASATAQSWCTPGSNWYHTWNLPPYASGYVHEEYVGDTVIDGLDVNRVQRYGRFYNSQWAQYNDIDTSYIYTRSAGGVVWLYENEFDTLYNFNASPGDRWGFPFDPGTMACDTLLGILVTDTGHLWIDGAWLRFLAVDVHAFENEVLQDTLIERMGALGMGFDPIVPCVFDLGGGSLRCFSDAEIFHQVDPTFGCASLTSIVSNEARPSATVSIDPNTGSVLVDLPHNGSGQLRFLDAMGREVKRPRAYGPRAVIEMADLPGGVYLLVIETFPMRSQTYRICWP